MIIFNRLPGNLSDTKHEPIVVTNWFEWMATWEKKDKEWVQHAQNAHCE